MWIRTLFAAACLSKDIDLRTNIPIILSSPQCHRINPHQSQFRPGAIFNLNLHSRIPFPREQMDSYQYFPRRSIHKLSQSGLDMAWWLWEILNIGGGRGRTGAGGRTKWKEMEFLVSNINISRNVPNCWKVAFTNGEKISKGGEKPLFWTDHLSFSEWPPQIFHIWSWTIVEA